MSFEAIGHFLHSLMLETGFVERTVPLLAAEGTERHAHDVIKFSYILTVNELECRCEVLMFSVGPILSVTGSLTLRHGISPIVTFLLFILKAS